MVGKVASFASVRDSLLLTRSVALFAFSRLAIEDDLTHLVIYRLFQACNLTASLAIAP